MAFNHNHPDKVPFGFEIETDFSKLTIEVIGHIIKEDEHYSFELKECYQHLRGHKFNLTPYYITNVQARIELEHQVDRERDLSVDFHEVLETINSDNKIVA